MLEDALDATRGGACLRVLGSYASSEHGKGDDRETHFGSDVCRLMFCWSWVEKKDGVSGSEWDNWVTCTGAVQLYIVSLRRTNQASS